MSSQRIKITNSNANVNSIIKVVPVNEFQKEHNKQLFIHFNKSMEKQYDILQFMDDSTSNYKFSEKPIFLQQIINKKFAKNNGEPEFGMGSSFKKQQKNTRVQADTPTAYTITIDKSKTQKKFKTVPQEMNPNSQYLILVRNSQTSFDAYPIKNWYKINPFTKLDINSIEESEREINNKNQSIESVNKKFSEKYVKEREEREIEFGNDNEELSDSEMQEKEVLNKRKKDTLFQRIRHGQGATNEGESDVDDHQGDEVDYMSDSSLDEDNLSVGEKEKLYETVDVDQEQFLRLDAADLSGQSDDEEEKKEEKVVPEIVIDDDEDDEDDDDDDSDSDDDLSDDEIMKQDTTSKKARHDYNNNLAMASLKRSNPDSSEMQSEMKKRKITDSKTEEILEEIRKHLKRKPLPIEELFKILTKKNLLDKSIMSQDLFNVCLKRLNIKSEKINHVTIVSL